MINSNITRKWSFLVMVAVGLLVSGACTQRSTTIGPTQSITVTFTPASSPTSHPTETITPTPQPTMTPTSLPISPSPSGPYLEDLPMISAENIARLSQVASVELNDADQVAWSPSGDAFAVSAPSGMGVYRLESFSAPTSIRYQSQPYFSADGAYLATRLENGNVQVWNLEQGTQVGEYSGMTGEVVYMAFSSSNGRLAAVSIDNQVFVWELSSREHIARLDVPEWAIPITYTYDLLFSADESQLALFREGEILLWEIEGSIEPRRLHWNPPPASPVHGPNQFSPDWSAVAWSDRGQIMIMDTASGEILNEFERQVGAPFAFTRDWGSLVVIGYNDTVISVWDPFSGEALQELVHPETVFQFWLSPDEHHLVSLTFEGRATLWDVTTGEELAELTSEGEIGDWLVFSPQSEQVALLLSDGRIRVWDVISAEQKVSLDSQATRTFLFSPDGSLLVTVSSEDGLQFWNTADGEQMLAMNLTDANADITPAFVYGGKLLAIETTGELLLLGVE
jgi:WD40 repeat protein